MIAIMRDLQEASSTSMPFRRAPSEELHGVIASALSAARDTGAGFQRFAIEKVLAVPGRALPPVDEAIHQRLDAGEAARIESVGDILRDHAVVVAVALHALRRLAPVGGVAQAIGLRHELGELA